MADEERAEFGKFIKTQSRYGTSSKATRPLQSKCILKHVVKPGDTIQGIAVKYGVTVEQIKQANKLWTNESLFLCATIDVPAALCDGENENGSVNGSSSSDDLAEVVSSPPCSLLDVQSPKLLFENPSLCRYGVSDQRMTTDKSETSDVNRVNVDKYFSKYDTVLDKARKEVAQIEQRQSQVLYQQKIFASAKYESGRAFYDTKAISVIVTSSVIGLAFIIKLLEMPDT